MAIHEESTLIGSHKQQRSCKTKYRMRWFYSKGAALVLIWTLLTSITGWSLNSLAPTLDHIEGVGRYYWLLTMLPGVSFIVAPPLSGWLADARIGSYKAIRGGFVLLFLAAIIGAVFVLITAHINQICNELLLLTIYTLIWSGLGICNINMLHLGLDQMPDASATNITSFIAWFAFCCSAGEWISGSLVYVPYICLHETSYKTFWALLPVTCICLTLCLDFILSPKWLIIEPKSPQSLKQIFQVLKFAKKHKAPIRRSALTYWEEDIPSRMDLGKSKYGGPFTTEQVENVKTFLRLLAIGVSIWIILFVISLDQNYYFPTILIHTSGLTNCTATILYTYTYHQWLWAMIGTLLNEFLIYPLFMYRLPSILKRIGIGSFLVAVRNSLYVILTIYFHYNNITSLWSVVVHMILYGLLLNWTYTCSLEFVCAQSPYNTRGLLTGYFIFLYGTSYATAFIFAQGFTKHCQMAYCSIIYTSLAAALSIIGFVLHCILAHWYKRRVRDDDYHPQREVEEVYDRYLSVQH